MSATRIYSTAAYYVAAIVAIILGLCPKFGVVINAIPGGVLGGITVVLYGMIGLIGAKIWVDNRIDFGNPVNIAPLAAGLIMGIGNVTLHITKNFELGGIALGTIVTIAFYHMVAWRKSRLDSFEAEVSYTSGPDSYLSSAEGASIPDENEGRAGTTPHRH
jgi:xanthine/uracil permease